MAALRTVLLSALVVTTSAQTAMWSIDSGSAFCQLSDGGSCITDGIESTYRRVFGGRSGLGTCAGGSAAQSGVAFDRRRARLERASPGRVN